MKILVCGGREFTDYTKLSNALYPYINQNPFIINGGYRGADKLSSSWAEAHAVPCAEVKAPWYKCGGKAGPIRNGWMLRLEPDVVIAFPGGYGTANMIAQAREVGVHVIEIT